jgi:hypothetical protein
MKLVSCCVRLFGSLQRAQRRKLLPQLRVHDLIDVFRRRQVLEADLAEIAQRNRGRQNLPHAIDDRLRQ